MKILIDEAIWLISKVMPGGLWFYLKDLDRGNRKCYFLKVVQVREKVSIETAQRELIALVTTGREAQQLTVQDGGHTHLHLHINVNNPLTLRPPNYTWTTLTIIYAHVYKYFCVQRCVKCCLVLCLCVVCFQPTGCQFSNVLFPRRWTAARSDSSPSWSLSAT